MTQYMTALSILFISLFLMFLGYLFPRNRTILTSIGFFILMTGGFASYSNWLPQTRGEVPPIEQEKVGDVTTMSIEDLSALGEKTIFGKVGGLAERGVGKGQCPLCHTFKAGDIGDRAPNLIGIGPRAGERVKEERYSNFKTKQDESFQGSGRATKAVEYIAESHTCPSCYVVSGFGDKGTGDTSSPMPKVHKAPIGLSIPELVAVDVWMFHREGEDVPPIEEIQAAYEKFIPEEERITEAPPAEGAVTGIDPKTLVLKEDEPATIVQKMGCAACHRIPTIDFAKAGVIGPLLTEGTNAARRIKSPEYREAVKAGKAGATTPKDYVIESIMDPSAFIVSGFPAPGGKSMMPPNFAEKFTYAGVSKMADFLLSLDVETAKKEGLDRSPMEKEGTLFPAKTGLINQIKDEKLASVSPDQG